METPDALRGRVLIVDDEPQLCTVIRRTLGSEHEVITVTSARQALELFNDGERFDIILCDLMMPQMTGMELHAELTRLVPDQVDKMIFMTGGAFSEEAASFLRNIANPTVEKPFKTTALRLLVRNEMQRAASV
jgi:CheY-like chemotaxis protein